MNAIYLIAFLFIIVPNAGRTLLADMPVSYQFHTYPFPENGENPETFAGITKTTLLGDTLWTVMLDSIENRKNISQLIISTTDGGCFAVFAPAREDYTWKVYKLNSSGEVQMSGEFYMQGGPILYISEIVETSDSSFLITGTTDDFGTNLYMFLVGIDSEGAQFIDIKEDFVFHASGTAIKLDDLGNIYIAGYTSVERDDGYFMPPENTDVFLLKLDKNGKEIWRTVLEYPLENRAGNIAIEDNGDISLTISSFSYDSYGSRVYGETFSLLYRQE